MLDIDVFRNAADSVRADHARRGLPTDALEEVIELDESWRQKNHEADAVRRERNVAARGIAAAKKSGDAEAADRILAEVSNLGKRIEQIAQESDELLRQRDARRMRIPNILHPEVPVGADEEGNTLHSMHGTAEQFEFEPRTHNELLDLNNWVELPRAAKITGSRFYFLKGDLARLDLALQQFAIDFLLARGQTLVQPPQMMNREAYEGVTDLADFETVMYNVQPDGFYLTATSEHPLTAMFMDEIIEPSLLPLRMAGVSACFRREVGAHGQSDKGIWRVHQFTKVEQVIICQPDDSWEHHEELLTNAVDLWNELEVHFRVVNICTGDMGTVAARKYDLEAWMPGVGQFKEVVSCSNCTDYQANRLSMRYRTAEGNESVHTLNSTAVATSRALAALLEQNQTAAGRVAIPTALRPYMGDKEYLEPCNW
jgi:seryl-tRNA synthetase